jgi:hypothetical protein
LETLADLLRCLACGQVAYTLDRPGDLDAPAELTAQQALRQWPERAWANVSHDTACAWRLAEAEDAAEALRRG